eukprot:GHVR01024716.1.p1 GENE.GHVR01024716.1~~GHVR01024716.1.p1  ORF type:complete len:196 (+),score=42.44 GHVR01024716.1:384-971(+)
MREIQDGGLADLAGRPYGTYEFNDQADLATVAEAIQRGWSNPTTNTILRDSSCRFARRVAGDMVAEKLPGLTAAAAAGQATVVSIIMDTTRVAPTAMEVTPPAAPVPENPVTTPSAETSDMVGVEPGQFDLSSPDQPGSEPARAVPEEPAPASKAAPAQARDEPDAEEAPALPDAGHEVPQLGSEVEVPEGEGEL